ncbi:GNAT family N-acetyltransferase [Leptospira perdikensis]|uniref:N-acetyltransferase n=1 Tax=Leptospira perdikensis TaxID=2484948 RepID=A0A4R9JK36_9LEPT|nr:GNAT family N-acetyltransferase [Leptospira perdikensis]TGL45846.1 N-acetyltransferase [Leptospira perdikensis]
MKLRNVIPQDIDLVFQWANDPDTRNQSYSSNLIPYEQHRSWFHQKIEEKIDWFIAEINEIPVGIIRFDKNQDQLKVNYSIDERWRGKGLGKEIISLALNHISLELERETTILGFVKKNNLASIKCFASNGFSQDEHDLESYVFRKVINND